MSITNAGADVWLTHIKEVWAQSSDGVLADVGDGLVHGRTKQKSADHLVTVDDKTRN